MLESPNLAGLSAGWVQIAYAGILSTAVAFTFQAIAQQYLPPSNAAIINSSETLFAAIGGALLLGERLTARRLRRRHPHVHRHRRGRGRARAHRPPKIHRPHSFVIRASHSVTRA